MKAFTCPVCGSEVTDARDVPRGFCTYCQVHTAAFAELVHSMPMADRVSARPAYTQHYDRDGDPISFARYMWLQQEKHEGRYGIIAQDELPHGIELSTVWLGYDVHHRTPPMLFETAIFTPDDKGPYIFRCVTAEEALEQHESFLAVLQKAGLKFVEALEEIGL